MSAAVCDVCEVEYDEDFVGPCQQFAPSATGAQILTGNPPMCPGRVSLTATLERRAVLLGELLGEALNLIEHEPAIDCTGSAAGIVRRGRNALADTRFSS